MRRSIIKRLWLILLVSTIAIFAYSISIAADSTGTICGVVVDSETGNLVPGTKITIAGIECFITNDFQTAKFKITKMQPGFYELSADCVGFHNARINHCQVKSGQITNLVFALESSTIHGPMMTAPNAIDLCTIQGVILDSKTKTPIPGVTIYLENSNLGIVNDPNTGAYNFRHVPAGRYRIVAKLIGYKSLYRDIELCDKDTIKVDFKLSPEAIIVNGSFSKQEIFPDKIAKGTIAGIIVDEKTKIAIPGATILVEGTRLGAAANERGLYKIENIPVGIYTLKVSIIGYYVITLNNIEVTANRITKSDIRLKAGSDFIIIDDFLNHQKK